jgi:hypothetical protein
MLADQAVFDNNHVAFPDSDLLPVAGTL